MNSKLENYLYNEYPKIFKTQIPIDCGDGWFFLLNSLLRRITRHLDVENELARINGTEEIQQVVALQIKEKFAGLRFYFSGGDSTISTITSYTEDLSHYICEETGAFDGDIGISNRGGWMKTCHKNQAGDSKWVAIYEDSLLQILEELKLR